MPVNQVARQVNIIDLINEYAQKVNDAEQAVQTLKEAMSKFESDATVLGSYAGRVLEYQNLSTDLVKRNLLKSAWRAAYSRLSAAGVGAAITAKDKKKFDLLFENPPAFTLDKVKEKFSDYILNTRFNILRGLAEVFVDLDPSYKSHSKVKIGVSGLPKRVIINYGEYNYYGKDRLKDIFNALAAIQGIEYADHNEMNIINWVNNEHGECNFDGRTYHREERHREKLVEYPTIDRGIKVKTYKKGTAHVIFNKKTLKDINRALVEFYGEVLPDAEEENAKPSASTEVSKDLQYYWTPDEVIKKIDNLIYIDNESKILEPSCGDGRMMDYFENKGYDIFGIEYHQERANQARSKGHRVLTANFLETVPEESYDHVVMNPPFYGKHYAKHVEHAIKFLKDGGSLVAVLPATARYDHGLLDGEWYDLPVASFAKSGTNVPTVLLKIIK